MGNNPCFSPKKKKVMISRNDEDDKDQNPVANVNTTIAQCETTSVGQDEKLKENLDQNLDQSTSESVNAVVFSYSELATATNNFRQDAIIGEGGFGPVFKGQLDKTDQIVAVKKLNRSGLQGQTEFEVEVKMFSFLRHPNIVNFIGYCSEGEERCLVYEFMPLGSLEDHLHDLKPGRQPLDWNTRMRIAAGAARGLNFLHNETDRPIIYRDLKSSNILLDDGFHPKLSDFGLAKFGPDKDKSHVSTRVMGTHGYCAPEYFETGQLTMNSDIYSYGVLLLELITGSRAMDLNREKGKHKLVDWALPMLKDLTKHVSLVDSKLEGKFRKQSLGLVMDVGLRCLQDEAKKRPSMKEVVDAMDYLTSQLRDRAATSASGGDKGQRSMSEGTENIDLDASKETRSLDKANKDRQRAVAEAMMWAKSCRGDKMKQKDD